MAKPRKQDEDSPRGERIRKAIGDAAARAKRGEPAMEFGAVLIDIRSGEYVP